MDEITTALAPYIHTRKETEAIRAAISASLTRPNAPALNKINLTTYNPEDLNPDVLSPDFPDGVRKSWATALVANLEARRRLETIRADINVLSQGSESHVGQSVSSRGHGYDTDDEAQKVALNSAISRVRERQVAAKAEIVRSAFDTLQSRRRQQTRDGSGSTDQSLDSARRDLLDSMHGDGRAEQRESAFREADEEVFALKKEVVKAQRDLYVKRTRLARAAEEGQHGGRTIDGDEDERQKAYALRVTRDRLIEIIEGELAKLQEDDEVVEGSDVFEDSDSRLREQREDTRKAVMDAYESYLRARRELVAEMERPIHTGPDHLAPTKGLENTSGQVESHLEPPQSHVEPLLDLIPSLEASRQDQEALTAQRAVLQRSLVTAISRLKDSLARMADESLLVEPRARTTAVWREATREAREVDEKVIGDWLREGERSIDDARRGIERVIGGSQ